MHKHSAVTQTLHTTQYFKSIYDEYGKWTVVIKLFFSLAPFNVCICASHYDQPLINWRSVKQIITQSMCFTWRVPSCFLSSVICMLVFVFFFSLLRCWCYCCVWCYLFCDCFFIFLSITWRLEVFKKSFSMHTIITRVIFTYATS